MIFFYIYEPYIVGSGYVRDMTACERTLTGTKSHVVCVAIAIIKFIHVPYFV